MKRKGWFLFGGVIACLGLTALILGARTPVNPAFDPSRTIERTMDVPPEISSILRKSCYNCHSSVTEWPWYSKLPLASNVVSEDVVRARQVMNFSEWPTRDGRPTNVAGSFLLAACATLKGNIMPPQRYTVLHPEARISKEETERFCAWSSVQAIEIAKANRARTSAKAD